VSICRQNSPRGGLVRAGMAALAVLILPPLHAREIDRAAREAELLGILRSATNDPAQRLRISWLGPPWFSTTQPGSWIQRNLESQFNIDLDPIYLHVAISERRIPLMMLSGDVPDVFWVRRPTEVKRNAYHGFATELPYATIAEHAPDYLRLLHRVLPDGWLLSDYEGANYGIPTFAENYINVRPLPGIWRMDWLRRVGIEKVPETLDEMYEAFWRFRHRDPDGDGRLNTYAFTPNPRTEFNVPEIFGAFGVTPANWMIRDDEVVWGGIQPGAKEALAFLRRCYRDGLIPRDYTLIDRTSSGRAVFSRGRTGYLASFGSHDKLDLNDADSVLNDVLLFNSNAELVPGAFPVGPDGQRGSRTEGTGSGVLMFGRHLRDHPEKILRVLHMMNRFATDPDLFLEARYGRRGVHWEWAQDRGFFRLAPFDTAFIAAPEGFSGRFDLDGNYSFFAIFSAPAQLQARFAPPSLVAFNETHRRLEWAHREPFVVPEVVPGSDRLFADLKQLQDRDYAEIITGRRSIDDFDTFVRNWLRRGGEELTREANRLFEVREKLRLRAGGSE
jgi:putative aldouronate transport system substrate-binding protein